MATSSSESRFVKTSLGPWIFKIGHVTLTTLILGWFVICRLWSDKAYWCTKYFDNSNFSHSIDITGDPKIKTVHVTWRRPFQACFVIRRLGLAAVNLPSTFEVYISIHYKESYERWCKMWKMGWFGVVRSHSRSLEIAPFDRAHTSFC